MRIIKRIGVVLVVGLVVVGLFGQYTPEDMVAAGGA